MENKYDINQKVTFRYRGSLLIGVILGCVFKCDCIEYVIFSDNLPFNVPESRIVEVL